jgi:hypothetical protein
MGRSAARRDLDFISDAEHLRKRLRKRQRLTSRPLHREALCSSLLRERPNEMRVYLADGLRDICPEISPGVIARRPQSRSSFTVALDRA